jgi:hypothetical protein
VAVVHQQVLVLHQTLEALEELVVVVMAHLMALTITVVHLELQELQILEAVAVLDATDKLLMAEQAAAV